MTKAEIDAVIQTRLARWGQRLKAEGATPILLLSVDQAASRVIVTTLEEITTGQVVAMLETALYQFRSGQVDERSVTDQDGGELRPHANGMG
jgi:hypothetical protein